MRWGRTTIWACGAVLGLAAPAPAQDSTYVDHPRLLFAADELPALRLQLADGGDDDTAYAAIRTWASQVLASPPSALLGSWEGAHTVAQLGLAAQVESPGTAFAAKALEVVLYLARNRDPTNDEFATALRLQSLAYGYDLAGAVATAAERDELRHEMRRYLDFMPGRFNYYCQGYNPYAGNHGMTVGAAMGLAVIALWDDEPATAHDSLQAALSFADQLVDKCGTDILAADGSYREGVLYAGWIVRMAAPYFEARRRFDGVDLAADARWPRMIEWLCYELDPTGGGRTLNLNDSPTSTRPLALHNTILEWSQMRWGSGLARYLHRHVVGALGYDYGVYADRVATALWSRPLPETAPQATLAAGREFAARGLYFYRSGWKSTATGDEVLFSFYSGKFYGGHAQEDQNQFTLTAYGRRWAADCGGGGSSQLPKETAAHNLILVDGRGQHNAGNSIGTDGRIAAAFIGGLADYIRADASAAYATYSPFNAPGTPFPTSDWSWGYDGGNPLERADRACLVVKGGAAPPYVVVCDDIRKDAAVHTYDWLLHTDEGHTFDLGADPVTITAPQAVLDVFFAQPRAAALQLSWAPFVHGGVDPPTARLVARAQTTEPRFCVALVPRAAGMPAPLYDASDDGSTTRLDLDWGAVQDRIVFSPHRQASLGATSTDGELAFVRQAGGGAPQWLLAEGTRLQADSLVLATLGDTASAACSGDTLRLSRSEVGFVVWGRLVIAVVGPGGPIPFRRDGDWVRSLVPSEASQELLPGVRWSALRPNPSRRGARLSLELAVAARTRVAVYDVRGARVATCLDARLAAGSHSVTWDGRDAHGRPCAPGIYFVALEAHGTRATRKLVLTR